MNGYQTRGKIKVPKIVIIPIYAVGFAYRGALLAKNAKNALLTQRQPFP